MQQEADRQEEHLQADTEAVNAAVAAIADVIYKGFLDEVVHYATEAKAKRLLLSCYNHPARRTLLHRLGADWGFSFEAMSPEQARTCHAFRVPLDRDRLLVVKAWDGPIEAPLED